MIAWLQAYSAFHSTNVSSQLYYYTESLRAALISVRCHTPNKEYFATKGLTKRRLKLMRTAAKKAERRQSDEQGDEQEHNQIQDVGDEKDHEMDKATNENNVQGDQTPNDAAVDAVVAEAVKSERGEVIIAGKRRYRSESEQTVAADPQNGDDRCLDGRQPKDDDMGMH